MKLKHQWSLGHNYLAGISAGDWWRLLCANRFAVDPAYWHRAAFITASSIIHSFYRWREMRRFGSAIEKVVITKPPLFILGHWRSGTTHLHNCSLSIRSFAYANTYQVVNPHTFLTTEEVNTRRFAFLVPDKRPMDNMALSFQSPQEDEFALLLGCFHSLYLGITFPRREANYSKYLTFRGVSADEIAEWKATFLEFAKKLTFKYNRALLFKSRHCENQATIELFPEARRPHPSRAITVFVRRNIFRHGNLVHLRNARTASWSTQISNVTVLYDAFFRSVAIPGTLP